MQSLRHSFRKFPYLFICDIIQLNNRQNSLYFFFSGVVMVLR